ncbi:MULTISPECIES: hypothetical protein [Bacillus]|mgnify:FL=1|uniref:Uncharacterized protein n=1 Tax=Bacillus glycinifermentans TaxID=1664069 RepID=A0A2I7ZJL7_9BACI|nr:MULTISPECIES: hypothetical protein [Bacillus]AUS92773.1 hypothetical protein [Bacillus glycinifermentans]AUS92819.1 hypothetical protein [Bacillus glycinifermentans]KMM60806.1 hypothetical protein ACH95_08545 [Bacillus glycinifermentans]MEC0476013.1 hypothetical protein [Bacillus licheniformis]MEC0495887.1 hypothetical protein [Bacillus glycinifermentans]
MNLKPDDILENGQRKTHTLSHEPAPADIYKSTPELLKSKTIELIFLLKYARKYRSDVYNDRVNIHRVKQAGQSNEQLEQFQQESYKKYEKATRKVWVIENIIADRIGYIPQEINDRFLFAYLNKIEKKQGKVMMMKSRS